MQNFTSTDVAVLVLELIPAAAFGLAGERVAKAAERWPRALRLILPALCALPYAWISASHAMFEWKWLALYAALPVAIAWLLGSAAEADPDQRGDWRDALVLLSLGLVVDLRWLEPLWPHGLAGLGKLLLVDAGLYGYVVMRRLHGTGFDFHFRWSDWKTGLRELAFFAPIVIALGVALGFLHPHAHALRPSMPLTWAYIFAFIAVPEELFFRAWVQNLLEKRLTAANSGASPDANRRARFYALVITSILFGLSHFNKRSTHFNWRYVILATIAGIFYGRAWRRDRRVPASAITHASVDAIWSFWF
ncbi:MAG TPA: CPBP family intramembrane glutamic endopeptidase [Terriglobales bacterium]|nr:CPBP family intramembrane glutamic endopeptidase [Terriglobales bacterium]